MHYVTASRLDAGGSGTSSSVLVLEKNKQESITVKLRRQCAMVNKK